MVSYSNHELIKCLFNIIAYQMVATTKSLKMYSSSLCTCTCTSTCMCTYYIQVFLFFRKLHLSSHVHVKHNSLIAINLTNYGHISLIFFFLIGSILYTPFLCHSDVYMYMYSSCVYNLHWIHFSPTYTVHVHNVHVTSNAI